MNSKIFINGRDEKLIARKIKVYLNCAKIEPLNVVEISTIIERTIFQFIYGFKILYIISCINIISNFFITFLSYIFKFTFYLTSPPPHTHTHTYT